MNPPRWGGPGVGWVWDQADVIAAVFACLFASPEEIRAGRLPGNQENTMSTKFKFPLGALVVLSTSFAIAAKRTEEADREIHLAAQRQAALAKNESYRAAGRTDLIPDVAYAASEKSDWSATLIAMDPPIEAGKVIARSEYLDPGVTPQYMVRYRAGDGRQTEAWFGADAIDFDPRQLSQPTESDATPERIRSDD